MAEGVSGSPGDSVTMGNDGTEAPIRLVSQDGSAITDSRETSDAIVGESTQPIGQGCVVNEIYRLEKIIGHGSMGAVWRARDLSFDRARGGSPYVAIKFFNHEFTRDSRIVNALGHEISKACKLSHPNIASVFSYEYYGAERCVIMEYLNGESLATFIARGALLGLSKEQRRNIIDEIVDGLARGLAYAHDCGVVHSDIKPANVFLTRDGQVRLRNFCNARAMSGMFDAARDESRTDADIFDGSGPVFASRNALRDETDVRGDVYAFACVVYELFAGKHPFGGKSAAETRAARLTPQPVKGLSRRENKALLRGLALSPEKRTPTIKQFMLDLSPPETSRFLSAGKFLLVSAAVVLLAGIASIWLPEQLDGQLDGIDKGKINDSRVAVGMDIAGGNRNEVNSGNVVPTERGGLVSIDSQPEATDREVQRNNNLAATLLTDEPAIVEPVKPDRTQTSSLPEETGPRARQDTDSGQTIIESQPGVESQPALNEQRTEQQAAAVSRVRALLANPAFNTAWDQQLSREFEVIAGAEANKDQAARLAAEIADTYINESRRLRVDERRFAVAQDQLTKAAEFDPAAPALLLEQTALNSAIAAIRAEGRRASSESGEFGVSSEPPDEIAALKQNFEAQVQGRDIVAANKTLAELRNKLPADDPYAAQEAPEMLADAYLALAQSASNGGRYTTAEALTNQARRLKAASRQAQQ